MTDDVGMACKACGAALPDASELVATIAARERTIRALKNELQEKRDAHKHRETVVRLANYWNVMCRGGRATAPAKNERFDKTAARLNEGHTEEQLMQAIDGAAFDPPWVIDGKTHDDLKVIMKSASSVEAHIERAPSLDGLLDKARERLALLPLDAAVVQRQKALRIQVSDWLAESGVALDGSVGAALGVAA